MTHAHTTQMHLLKIIVGLTSPAPTLGIKLIRAGVATAVAEAVAAALRISQVILNIGVVPLGICQILVVTLGISQILVVPLGISQILVVTLGISQILVVTLGISRN